MELKVAGTAGVGLEVLNIHNHPPKRDFCFVWEQNVPIKEELEQVLCLEWTSQVVLVVKNQCRKCRFNSWVGKIPWSRKRHPTPVFLPGEIPWTEEPGGLQSIGLQRVRHGWSDLAHTCTLTQSKLIPFTTWQANRDKSCWGKVATLFGKPADREDGGLVLQRNILTKLEFKSYLYSQVRGCCWLLQISWCQNSLFLQLSR